jgi:hypothetical protein
MQNGKSAILSQGSFASTLDESKSDLESFGIVRRKR